ncbi:hypothetical protein M231_05852 [Tremella mesenterica]|uniref:Uncharacterized protein n=1 Tax=Tremella mesenterica TaxID=5217 RepID=A0A4Q1BH12_TREME|nr:hypothetical protein M231_05852 [Tremella mesenterica]
MSTVSAKKGNVISPEEGENESSFWRLAALMCCLSSGWQHVPKIIPKESSEEISEKNDKSFEPFGDFKPPIQSATDDTISKPLAGSSTPPDDEIFSKKPLPEGLGHWRMPVQ